MDLETQSAERLTSGFSGAETRRRDVVLSTVALLAIWLPIIHLFGAQWSTYEQYRYGWAVPLLCVYLFWERWRTQPRAQPVSNAGAATVALISFGLLLLPARILQEANPIWRAASYLLAGAAILVSLIVIYSLGGRRWPRHFAFPIFFFLVAVLWPTPVEEFVIQKLTRLVTFAVTEFVNLVGIPAIAHGNVLEVSTGLVGVDEACSGVRSIQATFMIALFFGELYRMFIFRRVLLVLSGFGLAILLNVGRTAFLVMAAARDGIASVNKWHDSAGITVLLACFCGLWLIALFLRKSAPGRASEEHEDAGSSANGSSVRFPSSPARIRDPLLMGPSNRLFTCFSILAIALSLVSVVGSELWFRLHERHHSGGEEWTVEMPKNRSRFTTLPITAEVRGKLQFDTGESAAWDAGDGSRWQIFYFRWNPAHSLNDRIRVQFSKTHRPDICLPASGRELRQQLPSRTYNVNGLPLPFRVYEFADRTGPLFVFYCACEDRTGRGIAANMREGHAARLAAAWHGNRGLGQRVFEVAIWGMSDVAGAEAALLRELPGMIQVN